MKKKGKEFRNNLRLSFCKSARSLPPFRGGKKWARNATGAVRRVGTWRQLRLPRSIIRQTWNERQIAFSISWTRQEPRGLVGSSVISDPAVPPGSKPTVVNSLFLCYLFFQSEDSEKFQSLSHVRRWPPHMRASEVFNNLPAGFCWA